MIAGKYLEAAVQYYMLTIMVCPLSSRLEYKTGG
jgi:hypothetical protein